MVRRKKGWMNLKVSNIIKETHDTKTFFLKDAASNLLEFDYKAGQYLTFRFDSIGPKSQVRSYTMSSSPCQSEQSAITVKSVPGGLISNFFIQDVKIGDILRARGPIGKFCYPHTRPQHLFMIAAGSGVTPFVSILREFAGQLAMDNNPLSMSLLVAYRSQMDLICWPELQELSQKDGIEIKTTLTREENSQFWQGRPNDSMLTKFINHRYSDSIFMTCGPEGLMEGVKKFLQREGVEETNIMTESFAS